MKWAVAQGGMNVTQKSVLMVIAYHYNDRQHRSWPSHNLIAAECCIARSTAIKAVGELVSKIGILQKQNITDDAGRDTANFYYLPDFDSRSRPPSE